MSSWNEIHYARAQEFARLIADLTATDAPAAGTTRVPVVEKPVVEKSTAPAAPPAPVPERPAAPAPASPTAGSLFNKMPWKK